ncbi:hypothetical protein ABZ366_03630 [Streptomyces sp. NPDC005904]|uniref:hypothetical protein n=1 Tax=Streptomyces sp. NPDC005904 TaxID=3154570 RepID=UPI0033E49D0D
MRDAVRNLLGKVSALAAGVALGIAARKCPACVYLCFGEALTRVGPYGLILDWQRLFELGMYATDRLAFRLLGCSVCRYLPVKLRMMDRLLLATVSLAYLDDVAKILQLWQYQPPWLRCVRLSSVRRGT